MAHLDRFRKRNYFDAVYNCFSNAPVFPAANNTGSECVVVMHRAGELNTDCLHSGLPQAMVPSFHWFVCFIYITGLLNFILIKYLPKVSYLYPVNCAIM